MRSSATFIPCRWLAFQTLALWFMMLACRIKLPIGAAAIVFLVIWLGTALPNAPANVGSFQFFTVLELRLFGQDKTVAAGFSIIYFLALTIPLWILGLLDHQSQRCEFIHDPVRSRYSPALYGPYLSAEPQGY